MPDSEGRTASGPHARRIGSPSTSAPRERNILRFRRYHTDLVAQMAECDTNYLRLRRLMPELAAADARDLALSLDARSTTVHMRVVERCRYTTTVVVRQHGPAHMLVPAPALTVKLYHDLQTAEVMAYQHEQRFDAVYPYPNAAMRLPDEKAQVNRLLGEFLSLCLAEGRALEPVHVGS